MQPGGNTDTFDEPRGNWAGAVPTGNSSPAQVDARGSSKAIKWKPWSDAELDTLRRGIRDGLHSRQLAALFPDRTPGGVYDKAGIERRRLGIIPPKSPGRPSARISLPMLSHDAAPVFGGDHEIWWPEMCRMGSQALLEAYHRYYEKHVQGRAA